MLLQKVLFMERSGLLVEQLIILHEENLLVVVFFVCFCYFFCIASWMLFLSFFIAFLFCLGCLVRFLVFLFIFLCTQYMIYDIYLHNILPNMSPIQMHFIIFLLYTSFCHNTMCKYSCLSNFLFLKYF